MDILPWGVPFGIWWPAQLWSFRCRSRREAERDYLTPDTTPSSSSRNPSLKVGQRRRGIWCLFRMYPPIGGSMPGESTWSGTIYSRVATGTAWYFGAWRRLFWQASMLLPISTCWISPLAMEVLVLPGRAPQKFCPPWLVPLEDAIGHSSAKWCTGCVPSRWSCGGTPGSDIDPSCAMVTGRRYFETDFGPSLEGSPYGNSPPTGCTIIQVLMSCSHDLRCRKSDPPCFWVLTPPTPRRYNLFHTCYIIQWILRFNGITKIYLLLYQEIQMPTKISQVIYFHIWY